MKIIEITDDFTIVKRDTPAVDLIGRAVQKVFRDARRGRPPKVRKPGKRQGDRQRAKEYARNKKIRRALIASGLCCKCGGELDDDVYLTCEGCRAKWRVYGAAHRLKKAIQKAYEGA
jgi:hypothetical protein